MWVILFYLHSKSVGLRLKSLWNSDLRVILVNLQTRWLWNGHTALNQHRFDVDITSYVETKILINFHAISTYFFDIILMAEKLRSFWRTFFDVISMDEISTSFGCIFFDLTSMDEKSTLFRCIFWCNLDWKLI